MNCIIASIGSFPPQLFLGAATGHQFEESIQLLFYLICAVVGGFVGICQYFRKRARRDAGPARSTPSIAPEAIDGLVRELAHRSLGIGSGQWDEPIENLRIPRGDFLRFLDELEEDHGLILPASARTTSTSISGVIAALCPPTLGRAIG